MFEQRTNQVIELLFEASILDQEEKQTIFTLLSASRSPQQFISTLRNDICGQDEMKKCVDKMAKNHRIREILSPELQYEKIKYAISSTLEIDLNPENEEVMKNEIHKNIGNMEKMLTNLWKQFSIQQKLDQDIIRDCNQQIRSLSGQAINNVLRDQQRKIEQARKAKEVEEKKKKQEERKERKKQEDIEIRNNITLQLRLEEKNELQKFIKQLEGEIQGNQDIVDIKLRKFEIQLARDQLRNGSEPKISAEMRNYLNNYESLDRDTDEARMLLLRDIDTRKNMMLLRRRHCGLFIQEIFRMLKEGREISQKTLARLPEDKRKVKVVLFFGNSKAGKTTLITRLMNHKLVKTEIQGIPTLQPLHPTKEVLQELKIGYSNCSTTRFPRFFRLPKASLPKQDQSSDHEQSDHEQSDDNDQKDVVCLMDSPGLGQTAGMEVEIVNRILTQQILENISQLYIVEVINQKDWGSTGQGIQKLAKTNSSIFNNFKEIKKSVRFVFNQFNEDFQIYAQIKDLEKNIKKKLKLTNDNYKEFFGHLKSKSKNPQNQINPLTLEPSRFMSDFDEYEPLQPLYHFTGDIGSQCYEEINKLCSRCKDQAIYWYQKGQIKNSQYYINILKKIEKEKKLNSNVGIFLTDIKEIIRRNLAKELQSFRETFKELESYSSRDKHKVQEKITNLKKAYEHTMKSINDYKKIDETTQMDHQLSIIITDSLAWFRNTINLWTVDDVPSNLQDLIDQTRISIFLFDAFAEKRSQKQFQEFLEQTKQSRRKAIMESIKILNEENQINKEIKILEGLSKASFESLKTDEFKNLFTEIYRDQRGKIMRLFDLNEKNMNKIFEDDILGIKGNESAEKSTERFLNFIKVLGTLPTFLTQTVYDEANKDYKWIVITLPQAMMSSFENMTKEEEENSEESGATNKKIVKIKSLVKYLKFMNDIKEVKEYYGIDKLIREFNRLKFLIDRSLNYFEEIKKGFNNNSIEEIRKMMRNDFKRLETMIKISGSEDLLQTFENLKAGLKISIIKFIRSKKISQKLTLGKYKGLEGLSRNYGRLFELTYLEGMLDTKCEIKDEIELTRKEIERKIKAPIENLLHELKKNNISFTKLQNFFYYSEIITNEEYLNSNDEFINEIVRLNGEVQQQIRNINSSIWKPIQDLIAYLKDNMKLFESQPIKSIDEKELEIYRRSLKLLHELNENQHHELKSQYFSEAHFITNEVSESFLQYKQTIIETIGGKKVPINRLFELKQIASKLKYIQHDPFGKRSGLFDDLVEKIRQQIQRFHLDDQNMMKLLFESKGDTKKFQEEYFKELYIKFSKNSTPFGEQNLQKLRSFATTYRGKVEEEINQKKLQLVFTSNIHENIINVLIQINMFLKKSNVITNEEKLVDGCVKERLQIPELPTIIEEVGEMFLNNFKNMVKEVKFTKNEENEKNVIKIIKIEQEIERMKNYGYPMEIYEGYKKKEDLKYLIDQLQSCNKKKQQILDELKKKQGDIQILTEDFQGIFESLNNESQNKIEAIITANAYTKVEQGKQLFQTDYDQFLKWKQKFDQQIEFVPKHISKQIKTALKENIGEVSQRFDEKVDDVSSQISVQKWALYGIQLTKMKHHQKIDNLSDKIYKKENEIDKFQLQKCIQFLRTDVQSSNYQYESLHPTLQKRIEKIEEKLLKKILLFFQKNVQILQRNDSEVQSLDTDSVSGSEEKQLYKSKVRQIMSIAEAFEDQCETKSKSNGLHSHNIRIKIKRFFSENYEKVKKFSDQFQAIVKSDFNDQESIKKVFGSYQKVQCFLELIIKQQSLKIVHQLKFKAQQTNIKNHKKSLNQLIQKIQGKKFEFYSQEIRNNSDKMEQQRVKEFTNNMIVLRNVMSSYNANFHPEKQIIYPEIEKQIIETIEKQKNEIINRLEKTVENTSVTKIDERVIQGIRLFNVAKKWDLFHRCKDYSQEIKILLEQKVDEKTNEIEQHIKTFIKNIKNEKKESKDQIRNQQTQFREQLKELENQLQKRKKKLKQWSENIISNSNEEQKEKHLAEYQDKVRETDNSFERARSQMFENHKQKLKIVKERADDASNEAASKIIKQLEMLKKIQGIFIIRDMAKMKIDNFLSKIAKNTKALNVVYQELESRSSFLAEKIIDEHDAFNKLKGLKFTEETKKTNDPEEILDRMIKSGTLEKEKRSILLKHYKNFEKDQKDHIDSYALSKSLTLIDELKKSIKTEGKKMKKKHQKGQNIDVNSRVNLVAMVFALWSIITAEDNKEEESDVVICYKPHAAQILCVFLILCFDESMSSQTIKRNRLAEVKTGEGKSIVLAVLSIYFALMGYQVHCACYSEILSNRDDKQFNDLFEHCGVREMIHYGIFESIIKKILSQKNKESKKEEKFEDVIKEMMITDKQSYWSKFKDFIDRFTNFFKVDQKIKVQKVLLIDEIDVLFDRRYFGDTFNQSIELHDENIVDLFKFIWDNKNKRLSYEGIKQSSPFKKLIEKYGKLSTIMDNQIFGMIAALQTYKNQKYFIKDKRIYYKVNDSLRDVSYSYNTVYAYLYQYGKGNISDSVLNEHLSISLCVAEFSYALLPKYYHNVMGVTGTLQCLPNYIKEYLKNNYKINQKSLFVIPSVYGLSSENRKILPTQCIKKEDHYSAIIKNIQIELDKNKPILIFFKNKTELHLFYQNPQFKQFWKFTSFITEEYEQYERNQKIRDSCVKQTITLMTESFIRGTDFKLLNKQAIKAGGYHAIVAYLIDSPAEYIQATGRIARQGKEGTFIEIYPEEQLELLELNKNDPNALKKVETQRMNKQEKLSVLYGEKLKYSQEKHEKTVKIFEKFDEDKLLKYILKKNQYPIINYTKNNAKMVLIIDGTISMGPLFAQLKSVLQNIFDDVYETLKKKQFGCLELQLVIYRNYNSDENELIEVSTIQRQSQNLKRFISQAEVKGGWQNEAVEVALQYVNTLKEIHQVIIIGDAAGNLDQEVEMKRNKYPDLESKRIKKGLFPTNTQKELENLVKRKIKVSGFYLKDSKNVEEYFNMLSKSTNGTAKYIDIQNQQAGTIITAEIVKKALSTIGGAKYSQDLLNQYKQILQRRLK